MRKHGWLSLTLVLLLLCAAVVPAATAGFEEEDISLDDLVKIEEEQLWTFPVALEDLTTERIRIANKHYLLDKTYVCEPLVTIKNAKVNKDGSRKSGDMYVASKGMQLNILCAEALIELSDAARADGYNLYLKSAYRSYQTQKTMYNNRLKKNKGKDDGWVAKPGSSDHQTGLGCDVIPKSWLKASGMNSKMAKEPECKWMAEHCHEYGFIIRYPEDKQEITEINYEPWHLRYVGIPVATYIMENGLCLEEFVEQLNEACRDYIARGGDPDNVTKFIQTPTDE